MLGAVSRTPGTVWVNESMRLSTSEDNARKSVCIRVNPCPIELDFLGGKLTGRDFGSLLRVEDVPDSI